MVSNSQPLDPELDALDHSATAPQIKNPLFFRFLELFKKRGGPEEGRLKIKKPKHLQEILDITRTLLEGQDKETILPIHENKAKLAQMKSVLEM